MTWTGHNFNVWQKDHDAYLGVFLPLFCWYYPLIIPGGVLLIDWLVVLKFPPYSNIDLQSGTAVFRLNIKYTQKALVELIKDFTSLKKQMYCLSRGGN